MARFERIARDLEKLPCELHDEVLKGLEFAQLVRLSMCAGPRVTWSLENSLAPWGPLFREGHQLRKLLEVTDLFKKYCCKNPKTKEDHYWDTTSFRFVSTHGRLSFLSYQGSNWRSKESEEFRTHGVVDPALVSRRWLASLSEDVLRTTRQALHTDHLRLLEPWEAKVSGAQVIFAKARRGALSVEELSQFIHVYQRLRVIRAEAYAEDLCGLANLYEVHPTRLKTPFAPQTYRFNQQHIPSAMRREAQVIVKRASTTWWLYKEIFSYRFAYPFPALVMHDWTLQLFRKVMQKHVCLGSEHLEVIVKKTQPILDGLPQWAPTLLTHLQKDQSTGVSDALNLFDIKPQRTPPMNKYRSRAEGELQWLAAFSEVVAWMEVEFPNILREVRGEGWETSAK
ncbi:hypothetical protein DE146DRAFT_630065 [Phaeosphaeria sp. MPI-PUGE-AT-0046c]|nr:hypothetical protein DE146DRAFT_630065 [Phaeosphaeria sp. MPI-PUGE-AT-0046c]